jgi:hypothetical protein
MAASCRSLSCLAKKEKINVGVGIANQKHAAAALTARKAKSFKEDIEGGVPANLRENGGIQTGGLTGSSAL